MYACCTSAVFSQFHWGSLRLLLVTEASVTMPNGADLFLFSLSVDCYDYTISVVDHSSMSFTVELMQTYRLKLVLASAEAEVCSFG